MPSIPKKVEIEKDGAKILNGIKNSIGGEFKESVPYVVNEGETLPNGSKATVADALQSLKDYGNALFNYEALPNQFLNQLVNVIARQIIVSRLYRNPWAAFKQGNLELGESIEEIFVKLAHSQAYDPERAEKELFKREIPDIDVAFHRVNFKRFYKITIERDELRMAFISWGGLNDLISKIIESVYTSANFDEFIMMKYLIARAILNKRMASIEIPEINKANSDDVMINLKALSDNLQYMGTSYNYAGVPTYTDRSYQYFIFSTKMSSVIDVASLSRAFNLDKIELMGHVIGVNQIGFTTLEMERLRELVADNKDIEIFTEDELSQLSGIEGVVVDKRWFMIFNNLDTSRAVENGQGLYYNYLYHLWRVYSTSPFCNAVAFSTTPSSVTGVTITPTTATVARGATAQFTGTVTGTGTIMGSVFYRLTGATASGTTLNSRGLLTVSPYETARTLTVTAVSGEDPTKTASATVTISATT